jgi:toluene monooxygenase system ferredoxin subunit
MPFVPVCPTSAIAEGRLGIFQVGKKSVLLAWPAGGELKAYRGRCPHADMPLSDATFDGNRITCVQHGWGFDCITGKCVTHVSVRNALHPYEVRVEGGEILVDVGPIKAARSPA